MPLIPLSDEDKQFLRAILANPAELTAWLAYADWLDEHAQPVRAEFVRLQVQFTAASVSDTERHRMAARLEALRPKLDPNWVAVFDRPRIENCDETFAFKCPKKWEQLDGTDNPNARHCASCNKTIHYCYSMSEAYGHARRGHCVAVATAVARFPGDLDRPAERVPTPERMVTMGILLPPKPERRPWWKFW